MIDKIKSTLYIIGRDSHMPAWSVLEDAGRDDHSIMTVPIMEDNMKLADMIKLGVKGFKPSDIKTINESGIDTDAIISLAENGYSAGDVSELITLAQTNAESLQPGNDGQADPQEPADHSGDEGAKQDDYIEKINAQEKELTRMRQMLEAAQAQNSQRNLGGNEPKNNRKAVQEIFRNIY